MLYDESLADPLLNHIANLIRDANTWPWNTTVDLGCGFAPKYSVRRDGDSLLIIDRSLQRKHTLLYIPGVHVSVEH